MNSIYEQLRDAQREVSERADQMRREKEIHFTRAYLAYLEQGYTADDLCMYNFAPKTFWSEDGKFSWTERSFLGLKKDGPPNLNDQ
jgi:hypothetical protein